MVSYATNAILITLKTTLWSWFSSCLKREECRGGATGVLARIERLLRLQPGAMPLPAYAPRGTKRQRGPARTHRRRASTEPSRGQWQRNRLQSSFIQTVPDQSRPARHAFHRAAAYGSKCYPFKGATSFERKFSSRCISGGLSSGSERLLPPCRGKGGMGVVRSRHHLGVSSLPPPP